MQDTLCAWRMHIGMRLWMHSSVHPSGGMLEGGRSENAWQAGAKRRCQPKLERLVRVLFGSHPRGRGIQTVCSISPSRGERQRSGIFGTEAGSRDDLAATTSNVGSCCCYRQFIRTIARPINESAPQALSTVVRLSARSGSHPFPSVSRQRRARSQPTQRLTNRQRLSATRAEFRKVVFSILYSLSFLPFSGSPPCPPPSLSLSRDALNRITSMRDQTSLIRLRYLGALNITFHSNNI